MNELIQSSVLQLAELIQLPERIVNEAELPWVPFDDHHSCFFKPIRFDLNTGTWIYLFKMRASAVLGRHRHTGGGVLGYTLQGRWRYEGRHWKAAPGTFIFEPPGDIHTLIAEDEEVVALFILSGALQYFDDNNGITGQDDVYTILQKYRDFCEQQGMAARTDLIY